MKIQARAVTTASVLTALCAVTGLLPYVFFLPVTVAVTSLSIGAATFVGFAFGCVSVLYSYLMPTSIVSAAFVTAPYIAILARVLAALIGALTNKLLKKFIRNLPLRAGVVGAVTSLLNSAFVVGAFMLIMPQFAFGGLTVTAYVSVMLISGAIELVAMALLTPAVTVAVDKAVLSRSRKMRRKYEKARERYESEQIAASEKMLGSTQKEGGQESCW